MSQNTAGIEFMNWLFDQPFFKYVVLVLLIITFIFFIIGFLTMYSEKFRKFINWNGLYNETREKPIKKKRDNDESY